MKIVVCDDDVTVRSVVSRLAESVGHTVIAETDNPEDAVELVARFGAEAMVLDLSLPWGSGSKVVGELRERGIPCNIVVFSAYTAADPTVQTAAVSAIVDKPDFGLLERVLTDLAIGRVADDAAEAESERRKQAPPRPEVPPHSVRTASGLERPEGFASVVEVLEPGDAVLHVHVAPPEPSSGTAWEELREVDRFLTVARELRTVLRVQDRMTAEKGLLAALLLGGGRPGIESVWRRLERAHGLSQVGGVLTGGWAVHDGTEPPYAAVARARDAAERSIGQPPGDRLWAG